MKRWMHFLWAWGVLVLTACGTQTTVVPYRQAHHYFFCGDSVPSSPIRITSERELGAFFGMAAVMGRDGEPTRIDFSKEFVIASVWPETNRPTTLEPLSLTRITGGKLHLSYRAIRHASESWTMCPFLMLIVSRRYINLPVEAVEVAGGK